MFSVNVTLPWCYALYAHRAHRCEPSKTELVELYFHVIRSDMRNNITGGSGSGIEKLTFLNHTRCDCRPINYKPRAESIRRPPIIVSRPNLYGQLQQDHNKCRHIIKCAQPFKERFRSLDQKCVCDCIATNIGRNFKPDHQNEHKHCQDIQSGTGKLDIVGARLVRSGQYSVPVCAIGFSYNMEAASCLANSSKQTSHHHHLRKMHKPRHHHRRRHLGRTEKQYYYWNWMR